MSRRSRQLHRSKKNRLEPSEHRLDYYEMGRLKIARCSCRVFHKMSFNNDEIRRWGNEHLAGRRPT